MNIQTAIVLLILAVLLFAALRSLKKSHDKGQCTGCAQDGCSGHEEGGACPSVAHALDEVERRLGDSE